MLPFLLASLLVLWSLQQILKAIFFLIKTMWSCGPPFKKFDNFPLIVFNGDSTVGELILTTLTHVMD